MIEKKEESLVASNVPLRIGSMRRKQSAEDSTLREAHINTFLGNTYIGDVYNKETWLEGESFKPDGCNTSMVNYHGSPAIPPRLSLREIVSLRLGRGSYENWGEERRRRWGELLAREIGKGHVTVVGGSADTGMIVAKGGSTKNA